MRLIVGFTVLFVALCGFACGGGGGTGSDASHAGGAGGGSTTIDTHPQTATAFCLAEGRALCALVYQCVPAANRDATFTAQFGSSLSDCDNTIVPPQCTTASSDCPGFDATLASSCITSLATYSCTDFVDYGEPIDCADACTATPGTGGTGGGGAGGGGASGAGGGGGSTGQLPLCPSDYETADCPVANQSCRIDCASGMCGCTCMSLSGRLRWSCVIF